MTHSFPRWPLWLSLLLYFGLTAALIINVPLAASPDEAAHWQYVEHIAQTGELPVFHGAPPPAPGYEFHQPPLYYLLCAPLWNEAGAGAQNYACRAVSLLCGLGTIWLIWNAARLLFPLNSRVASVAAFFAALCPLHQAVSAGGNNDGLAGLVSATLFFLMARLWLRGPTWRDAWQLGFVAGLAILTKNTLLVVTATAFVALFFASLRPFTRVKTVSAVGAALGLMLLIGGPWLLRNQNLYGDPLALAAFSKAANAVLPNGAAVAPGLRDFALAGIDFLAYTRALVWTVFLTAWGFFGGPNSAIKATNPFGASGPRVPQLWLAPLMLACLVAPILSLLGLRRLRRQAQSGYGDAEISPDARSLTPLWTVGVVLIVLAWAQFAVQHFAAGQARYLHPALLPFCVLGAAGWVEFWGTGRALKVASALFGATLLLLTLLNVFEWKTLV